MKALHLLLFNYYARQALMSKLNYANFYKKRLLAMQMELQYCITIGLPVFVIGLFIPKLILVLYFHIGSFATPGYLYLLSFVFLFNIIVINKDFFCGQSVINRFLGYQIIDAKTNLPASPIRCAVRNCTTFMWTVEVIFALINPSRRIGDFIAGTLMIEIDKSDPELIIKDIHGLKFNLVTAKTLLVSLIITAINVIIALFFINWFSRGRVHFW